MEHYLLILIGTVFMNNIVLVKVLGAMRERLEAADVPAPFRGSAIAMITAGPVK